MYALSLDEYDGMLKKNGLQRPASLNVGKIKRDSSYQSLSSALSAEDVQKQHDMLQHSSTPLKAEDIATIVSGSLSLVDEIGSSEDEIEIQRTMEATGKPFLSPNSAAQKKKVLDEKQQERNKSYLKSKEATERKLLMESDSVEVEGLQIFRTSYKTWKNQGSSGDRKGGTSYIATK